MKILHISRTMGQGGAEKIVYQLCKDNNANVQCVISCGGGYVEDLIELGVKHFWMPDMDKKNPILMICCIIRIWYVVVKERVNIIHSHHRMAAFYARIVSIFTRARCIYTAHNVFHNKKRLLAFALENTQIVAVGDGVKKNLIDEYGIIGQRVKVIYNSINVVHTGVVNEQLKLLKKSQRCLVGNIGRITQQKGIDIFLEAMAEVVNKNANVMGVLVGEGEKLESMKEHAKKIKIDDHVLFLGYQKNVLDIIRQLDFVVLSSRWEGLPLTPIETFSQGKTIIVSNISGNNEIVSNGENGLMFECENIKDLSKKIITLVDDSNLRIQLEKNAKNTFERKFCYTKFIDDYNLVYKNAT